MKKEKRSISMSEARLSSPGRETWGPKKSVDVQYIQRCKELLHEEQARNPRHEVTMNVNHVLRQVTFSYRERDLEWEHLKHRIDETLMMLELDKVKRFFNKR